MHLAVEEHRRCLAAAREGRRIVLEGARPAMGEESVRPGEEIRKAPAPMVGTQAGLMVYRSTADSKKGDSPVRAEDIDPMAVVGRPHTAEVAPAEGVRIGLAAVPVRSNRDPLLVEGRSLVPEEGIGLEAAAAPDHTGPVAAAHIGREAAVHIDLEVAAHIDPGVAAEAGRNLPDKAAVLDSMT